MNAKINGGNRAFTGDGYIVRGLSKREYIAVRVMQGSIGFYGFSRGADWHAENAVLYADALLEELNEGI